jgi:hypothetical protein
MRRSLFVYPSLTLAHPGSPCSSRCECLKRHSVGECESELGADFGSLVFAKIHSQLKEFICEMRRIPPPGSGVSNIDGGPLFDPRISVPTWRFGPFTSIQAFHEFLHDGFRGQSQYGPGSPRSYRSARRALAATCFYSRRPQQPKHSRQGRPGRRHRGLGDCRLVPVILGVYHCLPGKSAKLVLERGDRQIYGPISGRTSYGEDSAEVFR